MDTSKLCDSATEDLETRHWCRRHSRPGADQGHRTVRWREQPIL